RENSRAPARSVWHPWHCAGGHPIVESGSSTSRIVTPGRTERAYPACHPSNPTTASTWPTRPATGGLELLDEFVPERRVNSADSASSSAILARLRRDQRRELVVQRSLRHGLRHPGTP